MIANYLVAISFATLAWIYLLALSAMRLI